MRLVYCPGEWKKLPVETLPTCSGCGTPFRKTENQLGDAAWFEADCMKRHMWTCRPCEMVNSGFGMNTA
jgi:hypothetical protein